MKRDLLFAATLLLVSLTFLCGDASATSAEWEPGQAIYRWTPECSRQDMDSLLASMSAVVLDSMPEWPTYWIGFAVWLPVDSIVQVLTEFPCVIWAQPNYLPGYATADPYFDQQWYLDHQEWSGSPWAEVHAPEGWTLESGRADTRIAVFDSGIPYDDVAGSLLHPDLQNSAEDYPFELRPVAGEDMNDLNGHGTWVAGVLAANTNNEVGIAGLANRSTIIVYNISTGLPSAWKIRDAIRADGGHADIINMSLARANPQPAIRDEIQYAADSAGNHVLFVIAAGNYEGPSLDDVWFPAAYADSFPNVLAVGGTNLNDEYWQGARIGHAVNISAPADTIFTCDRPNIYTPSFGATSAATPMVAATAALVLSQARESGIELTATEIRDIITESSDDCNWELHRGRDDSLGYGRVNAFKALLWTPGVKELEADLIIEPSHYDTVSPYRLRGTLVVPDGLTLTIEPGTRIVFADSAALYVEGSIIAQGTEEAPIRFEADSGASWDGIVLYSGATGTLEHCEISGGTWVQMQSVADVTVRDCHIHDMVIGVDAYEVEDGTLLCESNLIEDCALYGIRGSLSSGTFADNTIENCGRAGIYWLGDHPYTAEAPYFFRNEIASNGTGGTPIAGGYFNSTTANLRCNQFNYNTPYQILCENGGNDLAFSMDRYSERRSSQGSRVGA